MKKAIQIAQIVGTLWTMYIFLGSLPYKFTNHPHTQNIFGTIGDWMGETIAQSIGNGFSSYGAYVIGVLELIISFIFITALYFTAKRNYEKSSVLFGLGGLGAMCLMIGAVFFHLATPLGIEVNGDGGSLFRAAVSIICIGMFMFLYNHTSLLKLIHK